MTLLGWTLVILAILMITGLLGPILGVVLGIAALPFLAVAGVVMFPVLLVLMVAGALLGLVGTVLGGVFAVLGFVLHWGLPLLVLAAGVWVLNHRPRPRLTA